MRLLFGLLFGAATAILFLGCGSTEDISSPSPTDLSATPTVSPLTTPARSETPDADTLTPTETAAQTIYRNEKYGYQVVLPPGWRVGEAYMQEMAERLSSPAKTIEPEDYVLLTSLTKEEELSAIEAAKTTVAIGLEPWFRFAEGQAIHIFPLEVLFQGISREQFVTEVDMAGIVRSNTDVRDVKLDSGESGIRLTRREADDNGDITYDIVLAELSGSDVVLRIVSSPGYAQSEFETVFSTLRFD